MSGSLLSVIIPAYNEEENIELCVRTISAVLLREKIPYEIVLVNDNSKDRTPEIGEELKKTVRGLRIVHRTPPGGFGRAIRTGLMEAKGDFLAPMMADLSDDPDDLVRYYRKMEEGYDCVFGSRFLRNSAVEDYPKLKLLVNRIVNTAIQILFLTRHNDLTNAFKIYRKEVIQSIAPLRAAHFNITIELSLSAVIRNYRIAILPINWYGRKWGQSNLRLRTMGRRYLATLLKIWFERILIIDDILADDLQIKE